MRAFYTSVPWLLSLALAGCAAPDLGPMPQIATPARFPADRSLASAPGTWPSASWWRGYRDPQLDQLVTEALASAPDIAAAQARIRSAQGLAEQAGAARAPSITAEGSAGLNKQSYNNGIPADFVPKGWNDVGRLALDANLDLDIWGRNRAAYAAAVSDTEAAQLEGAQAALVLSTDIVSAYADLAGLYAEQDVLHRAVEVRGATAKLVAQRVATGLDTQAELKQSSSAVPAARADLGANAEQIALTRSRIAALVGAGPDRALTITRPAPLGLTQDGLPEGAGIALIGRRPDIAAARARAESAADRIKVARADFYPNISLSGLIGLQSLGLSNLFKGTSSFGNLGPAISLPIFRGGELKGRYRERRGQYDEAVANYDRTLLTALREVADAVTSRQQLGLQLADARAAAADARGAYDVAQLRYRGGLSTFLNVLSAQEAVIAADRTLARLDARRFSLDVALVRALGGGFRTATSQTSGT